MVYVSKSDKNLMGENIVYDLVDGSLSFFRSLLLDWLDVKPTYSDRNNI